MKFYTRIKRKPNSIIEEKRDGFKVISRNRLCVAIDGVIETDDPETIRKLKKRPDLFRTDRPWTSRNWRETVEGVKLLEIGVKMGLDIRHIRKEYLEKLIADSKPGVLSDKEKALKPEPPTVNKKKMFSSKPTVKNIDYVELMKIAKKKGVKATKRKDIEKILLGKQEDKKGDKK